MQIWYRRLAALLAVFMLLAALAACANDERDDEQAAGPAEAGEKITQDRKSTRLNSSHWS